MKPLDFHTAAYLRQQANPLVVDRRDTMTIEEWYMDDDTAADQRLPHRQSPNAECDSAALEKLGTRSAASLCCLMLLVVA